MYVLVLCSPFYCSIRDALDAYYSKVLFRLCQSFDDTFNIFLGYICGGVATVLYNYYINTLFYAFFVSYKQATTTQYKTPEPDRMSLLRLSQQVNNLSLTSTKSYQYQPISNHFPLWSNLTKWILLKTSWLYGPGRTTINCHQNLRLFDMCLSHCWKTCSPSIMNKVSFCL